MKGDPRCWRKGRLTGSKSRPKGTEPFACPYCHKPIGRAPSRLMLPMERIPDYLRQQKRMRKHVGQQRIGSRGFVKGYDPARNLAGRPIGKQHRAPRVPPYCKHCKQRIPTEWAKLMVKRWRKRNRS